MSGKNTKICATCKWVEVKKPKSTDVRMPSDGFCYANPPRPGGFYPKVELRSTACRLHEGEQ
jgi:hypothetical protein